MPVIIDEDNIEKWLLSSNYDELNTMLRPANSDKTYISKV
jgi:putative SOS response-associated peptidase YedK